MRRRNAVRAVIVVVAALAVTIHGDARAQDETERARATYAHGQELARGNRFVEAATAFAEADAIVANDAALEAALDAALLGDDAALAMNLVERGEERPALRAQPVMEQLRAKFSGQVGCVRARCLEAQPPCRVRVSGVEATRPRLWLRPGSYVVDTGAPGARTQLASGVVVVRAGEVHDVEPPVREEPPMLPTTRAAATPAATAVTAAPDDGAAPLPPWAFVGACAVTTAFGALAVSQGLVANGQHDTFEAALDDRASRGTLMALRADGEAAEGRANGLLAATAVSAAATLVLGLFFVDWSSPSSSDAAGALALPSGGAPTLANGAF